MRPGISRSAVERIAEMRIRAAMEEGCFDNLPGQGRPIAGIDEPYDPLWWVRSWMQRLEHEHGLRLRR
jgi:hypothetical protein